MIEGPAFFLKNPLYPAHPVRDQVKLRVLGDAGAIAQSPSTAAEDLSALDLLQIDPAQYRHAQENIGFYWVYEDPQAAIQWTESLAAASAEQAAFANQTQEVVLWNWNRVDPTGAQLWLEQAAVTTERKTVLRQKMTGSTKPCVACQGKFPWPEWNSAPL